MKELSPYKYKKLRSLYNLICSIDYKEEPVNIICFLMDNYYLGKFTCQTRNIYPGWQDVIAKLEKECFSHFIVSQCAEGLGSSFVICGCLLPYALYRINCLKNPWEYFGIKTPGKLEVAFFSNSPTLDQDEGFNIFRKAISMSPWFLKRGGASVLRNGSHVSVDLPLFRFILISPEVSYDGELNNNIVAGVIDTSGSPNDFEGHKQMVCRAFHNTVKRKKGEKVGQPLLNGKMFIIAPKSDSLIFLRNFGYEMNIMENIYYIKEIKETICPGKNISIITVSDSEGARMDDENQETKPQPKIEEPKTQRVDIIDSILFPQQIPLKMLVASIKKFHDKKREHRLE